MNTIDIKHPKELNYKKTYNKILSLAKKEVRSKDIRLKISFIVDPEAEKHLINEFRKLKNKVFFNLKT